MGKLKQRGRFKMMAWWKARGGKIRSRVRFKMMALWKARGEV